MKSVIAFRYLLAVALVMEWPVWPLSLRQLVRVPLSISVKCLTCPILIPHCQTADGRHLQTGLHANYERPRCGNGELFWPVVNWVAYDLNKRGGILVDEKRRKSRSLWGIPRGNRRLPSRRRSGFAWKRRWMSYGAPRAPICAK